MEVNILLLAAVLAIFVYLYRLVTRNNDFFHDKPIPSLAVKPLFGSTASLMLRQVSFTEFVQSAYDKFPNVKVFGLFDTVTPIFVIRDPELIKQLAVKDFDHFVDHRPMFGTNEESNKHPLALFQKSVFSMNGQRWKDMRATLSPAFTGSKMRLMFRLMGECCDQMVQHYEQLVSKTASGGRIRVEVKDMMSRIAVDIIGSCAFGLKVDCFKDRDNEFLAHGKKLMDFSRLSLMLKMITIRMFPKLSSRYGLDMVDREQARYFTKIFKETIAARVNQGIVRHDMIDLLLLARKGILRHPEEREDDVGFATVQESEVGKAKVSKPLTETEMIAQCLLFFLGGFDTVSNTSLFVIYELVRNPDVQQKLYEEIVQTNEDLGGKPLTYEDLQRMKYMDMVVSETLRMWTTVAAIDRLCVQDYVLDDGEGLRFTIEKGSGVWFPAQGLHHDPQYFPNPSKFDPERFSEENRSNINLGVYMPFGIGPRNCIGSRFALMEVKVVIYYMLLKFRFNRNEHTQIPLKLSKDFVAQSAAGGLHVDLQLRTSV